MRSEQASEIQENKVTAVLDVRALAQRCITLEKEIEGLQLRCNQHVEQMQRTESGLRQQRLIAEFGSKELERVRSEIRTGIRAIVHHSRDQKRLQSVERILQDQKVEPNDLCLLRNSLRDELQAMYPTAPRSKPAFCRIPAAADKSGWRAFQFTHQ